MSDLMAVPSRLLIGDTDVADLMDSIDLNGCHRHDTVQSKEWLLAESHRQDAPLGGPRTFDDDRWTAVFAGDLVDHETVPFRQVLAALGTSRWEFLAGLNGIFSFAAYDKRTKRLFAVSDRRSQKPLFYRVGPQGLLISTNLAMFVRISDDLKFDRKWLWQSLFFNFPVDDSTFLEHVKRVPPACVLAYDCNAHKLSMHSYAGWFKPRYPLLKGQEALRLATDVFGTRVPAYYHGAQNVACALTGGWDGRTLLAMAPADKAVTAYTYGGSGCRDLAGAATTASAIGVNHLEIPFDQAFVDDLPHHALETVYLSAGLQGVLRSTLHHAYDILTNGGVRFPLTISGISLGTQLRGAAQYPDLISLELAQRFQGLGPTHTPDYWRTIIGNDESEFTDFIRSRLELLEEQFGSFVSPAHHLSYIVYPASAHYFCGELAISDQYTTVRVPAWDSGVIELGYMIEQSTLSFSHFVRGTKQVRRKEMILQAHLLREFSPDIYRIPVVGIHPATVLAGEVPYQVERAYRAIERQISNRWSSRGFAPLENWDAWLFDQNRQFVEDLLQSSETLVADFIESSFIDQTITTRNLRLLGKLLTTEIILRLIKTRWQRFW